MKSIALSVLLAVVGIFSVSPANISDFFISEPDSIFAVLDKSARMDMVDYFNSGKKIETANSLDGMSRIEEMTPSYMKVSLSKSADVELQMEVVGKSDTLLFVIKTLKTPALDSSLLVFDKYWNKKDTGKYFKMLEVEDFLQNLPSKKKKELLSLVEFPLVSLRFEDGSIEAVATIGDYMIKENYKQLEPYLKKRILYDWDGKKFKFRK